MSHHHNTFITSHPEQFRPHHSYKNNWDTLIDKLVNRERIATDRQKPSVGKGRLSEQLEQFAHRNLTQEQLILITYNPQQLQNDKN